MATLKLGFIGLGTMGTPIAINLLKAGFDVRVYELMRDSENVKKAVKLGAKLSNSAREVALDSEFILMSLPNPDASEQATLGDEGILKGASPGSVIVELSTVTPSTIKKIATAAEPLGVDVLDAPVSGGRSKAEAATLTIMVGGKRETFDRCMPIFKKIGEKIYYVGGLGSAETVKLLNSLLGITMMVTVRSVLEIATKAGIDLKLLQRIIDSSTGQSWMWTNWVPNFLEKKPVGSTIDICKKDLTEALKMAETLNLRSEIGQVALNVIKSYADKSMGKSDVAALFDVLQS